jgi:hypothetical protein
MIDFCIPYVPQAHHHLVSLIENLFATTSDFDRLRFFVSCHSNEGVERISSDSFLSNGLSMRVILVPPVRDSLLGAGSANHTRALNALRREVTSEIVIFSDSDIRFLVKNWDLELDNVLSSADVFGTPYSNILWPGTLTPHRSVVDWLCRVNLAKYQKIPNATFIAFKKATLEEYFPKTLSNFDSFLLDHSLPYRVINSTELSRETNLPLGTIQWLDTGWELPHILAKKGIKHKALDYVPFDCQAVIHIENLAQSISPQHQPEIFKWSGTPFLAHYKKGSGKGIGADFDELLSLFEDSIKQYLG